MASRMLAERAYPYVFGVAAGLVLWRYGVAPSPAKFDSMLTSAISVCAILLGFLGTAKAMLLGFKSDKFSWVKSRPAVWSLVLGYLKVALLSSFAVCLASLLLLVLQLDRVIPQEYAVYVPALWTAAFVVAVSTFYRVVAILFALLRSE